MNEEELWSETRKQKISSEVLSLNRGQIFFFISFRVFHGLRALMISFYPFNRKNAFLYKLLEAGSSFDRKCYLRDESDSCNRKTFPWIWFCSDPKWFFFWGTREVILFQRLSSSSVTFFNQCSWVDQFWITFSWKKSLFMKEIKSLCSNQFFYLISFILTSKVMTLKA